MVARRNMRVVSPGEPPVAPKCEPRPKTLVEAIASGDYLEILKAQRRDIVSSLPDEKGPAKAALHRQLSIISKEIEQLDLAAVSGVGSVVADTDDDALDESAI
jgi:hypothetical protein